MHTLRLTYINKLIDNCRIYIKAVNRVTYITEIIALYYLQIHYHNILN